MTLGARAERARDAGRRPPSRPGRRRSLALAWAGILAGPAAWAVAILASYTLVPVACETGWTAILHGVRVATGLVALATTAGAFHAWGRGRSDDARPHAAPPFLALVGVVVSGFSFVLIVYEGIANFVVDPCL